MADPQTPDDRPNDSTEKPPTPPARRPSGAPEIPEILRERIEHPSKNPKAPSVLSSSIGEAGIAMAIAIDFLVAVAAGAVVGWLIDRWLGWSPYGLVVGICVGFAAGLARLIHRLSKEDTKSAGRAKK